MSLLRPFSTRSKLSRNGREDGPAYSACPHVAVKPHLRHFRASWRFLGTSGATGLAQLFDQRQHAFRRVGQRGLACVGVGHSILSEKMSRCVNSMRLSKAAPVIL